MRAAWRLDYDSNRYSFARFLRTAVFAVADLEQLHQSHWIRPGSSVGCDDNLRLRERMQRLPLHSGFYTSY